MIVQSILAPKYSLVKSDVVNLVVVVMSIARPSWSKDMITNTFPVELNLVLP